MKPHTDWAEIFYENLGQAIKFHELNPNDPHNIGNAVIVSLREVQDALGHAMKGNRRPTPVLKCSEHPSCVK